jgi:NADH:ubiquinone oxidoreductase subunit 6 (subunit J)
MTAALIFVSTFVLVFALGFQSLNVNNGHYKAAFLTSFAIAASNLILFKTVPQAGVLEIGAYLIAGPFAIVCSMAVHDKWMKGKRA